MTEKNKTPNCEMHEALVSYLYGEATPEEGRRFESHLKECAACAQELASFERVRGALQQWQLDDAPVFHFSPSPREEAGARRSLIAALRELFGVMPLWAKALGAAAAAVLVLAVLGTEVRVEDGNFSVRMDVLRRGGNAGNLAAGQEPNAGPLRAEIQNIVQAMMAESQQQQNDKVKTILASFEAQLQGMKSAELARLAERVQEHNKKIRTLERDIDRRDELDLTDILFSELPPAAERATGGDEGGR